MWANRGDMRFYNVTSRSQLPPAELQATSLVAVDWGGDLDLDILVADPNTSTIGVLENLRLSDGSLDIDATTNALVDLAVPALGLGAAVALLERAATGSPCK